MLNAILAFPFVKAPLGALSATLLVALGVAAPFNAWTPSETDLTTSAVLTSRPAPLPEAVTLRIVTFNVHDLMLLSKDRPERMRAIGQALVELDPDIAGIQEAFIEGDRAVLFEALAGGRLQYHRYFPSATAGSGLLTLSAYPIAEGLFHRYSLSNPWFRVDEGDWWAGKGVSLARIELPDGAGWIDFYNTHAQAGYGNPAYEAVRETQMAELAAFVRASETETAPAFLVGDMNCRPGRPDFEIAVTQTPLERLMTLDTRIDHIFAVPNARYRFEVLDTQPIERVIDVPRGHTPLSDHTGYLSEIRITPTR